MSVGALNAVWERSRAKGSNFTVLLGIADLAKDDGRDAYPSPGYLAGKSRLTVRAAELILVKLVTDGELLAEWNDHERRLYFHLRCVCEWPIYRVEGLSPHREKFSRTVKRTFAQKLCGLTATSANARAAKANLTADSGIASITDPSGPVIDPSEEPGNAPLGPDADGVSPEQAFADLWNERTFPPILPCVQLTAQRRRHIRKRLTERSLTEWTEVFARIQASPFCHGQNERGWVADFAWVIGSADVAVKVLEGKYDYRPGRERPFTATELADAKRVRSQWFGGCQHEQTCASYQDCLVAIIRKWRRERGEAA